MNFSTKINTLLIVGFILIYACAGSVTEPVTDRNTIVINLPLNQTAVYATAIYSTIDDSSSLRVISINKFQLNRANTRNDTTFYQGTVKYKDALLVTTQPDSIRIDAGRSDMLITADPNWILEQYNSKSRIYYFLFKPIGSLYSIDTTKIPTILMSQFPVYPRVIRSGKTYKIIRPGNQEDYIGVYREFYVKEPTLWSDNYGITSGLRVSTLHLLEGISDTLRIEAIMDDHGIVISQMDVTSQVMDQNLQTSTEAKMSFITRRIRDFGEAQSYEDFSYFLQELLQSGLTPLIPFTENNLVN